MIKKLLCLCVFVLSFQLLTAQETASISENALTVEEQLTFYPNPAKDAIVLTNTTGIQVECSVFNILGDQVLTKSLVGIETDLSIEPLPSGVYIVVFYHTDKTITERLIKE